LSLEAGDKSGVAGDFAVQSAVEGVVMEGLGVGELILELQ
jgi:L-asparaginase/Glu-tRNA(Gln) amidotransferase subunit D